MTERWQAKTIKAVPNSRALKWQMAFKAMGPVERLQNVCRISREFDAAQKRANDNEKRQLKADLVYAVGDRSTATRVIAISTFAPSLIKRAKEHLQNAEKTTSNKTLGSPDKNGTRADKPIRMVRTTGFSVTHLLALALIGDSDAREAAVEKSIQEKWTIDDLKRNNKHSEIRMPNAPKARPTRLTYVAHKRAGEQNVLLSDFSALELPASANAIKKSDRPAAIHNCNATLEQLTAVQSKLSRSIKTLEKLRDAFVVSTSFHG
jgi:hypothetical protein